MKRTSIVILFLLIALMFLAFTACEDNKKQETETTTVATTELTTIATTAEATSTTDEEIEEIITDTPETTMPKPQPTKPQPTEPKPTQPSGGGQFTWDDGPGDPNEYVQDPNTDAQYWVDKEVEELGENLNWELY